MGQHDFLLLVKKKNDTQTWANIPPRIMDDLPEFDIGKLSKEDEKEEKKQREERRNKTNERNNVLIEEEEKKKLNKDKAEKEFLQRISNDYEMSDEDANKKENENEVNEEEHKMKKMKISEEEDKTNN